MFEWDSKLDTGVESIDRQHRQLVATLDKLFEAMKDGAGIELLSETLDSLDRYAADHFTDEEQLMAASDYPEIEGHRGAHRLFRKKIEDLSRDFRDNQQGALSIRVVLFLRNWLTEHIGSVDQQQDAACGAGRFS